MYMLCVCMCECMHTCSVLVTLLCGLFFILLEIKFCCIMSTISDHDFDVAYDVDL